MKRHYKIQCNNILCYFCFSQNYFYLFYILIASLMIFVIDMLKSEFIEYCIDYHLPFKKISHTKKGLLKKLYIPFAGSNKWPKVSVSFSEVGLHISFTFFRKKVRYSSSNTINSRRLRFKDMEYIAFLYLSFHLNRYWFDTTFME